MRTVYIRDDLHMRLKQSAATEGQTMMTVLENIVESGLREYEQHNGGYGSVQRLVDDLYAQANELARLDFDFTSEEQVEMAETAEALFTDFISHTSSREVETRAN